MTIALLVLVVILSLVVVADFLSFMQVRDRLDRLNGRLDALLIKPVALPKPKPIDWHATQSLMMADEEAPLHHVPRSRARGWQAAKNEAEAAAMAPLVDRAARIKNNTEALER